MLRLGRVRRGAARPQRAHSRPGTARSRMKNGAPNLFPRQLQTGAFTASQLSGRVAMDRFHLSVEPGFGHTQVALNRLRLDTQHFGGLFHN
jgi:hypothetical protein